MQQFSVVLKRDNAMPLKAGMALNYHLCTKHDLCSAH